MSRNFQHVAISERYSPHPIQLQGLQQKEQLREMCILVSVSLVHLLQLISFSHLTQLLSVCFLTELELDFNINKIYDSIIM